MSIEEVSLFILLLCLAGLIAGITAGLFGNGGGFVVVPALLAVFPFLPNSSHEIMRVAVGTSLASIVISSARAVQAHRRRGAVDFQVLRDWSLWILLGVAGGLVIASYTDSTSLVFVFAGGVLVYSIYFLFPNLFDRLNGKLSMPTGIARASLASFLGGFSSLLGIGGGTITVMTMVLCDRPVHQAVATASGIGFLIGLPGAIGFMLMGLGETGLPFGSVGYINIPALLAISLFSVISAPIGARMAHSMNELHLKRLFGVYLVIVSISMFAKTTGAL
ncbi:MULTISPECIES: sulfite exporter TauE/SafE family protein [Microbulbifer]|uniref:sulfite exporter TauE/SafE family protein n=1 Tax=Microbulbifer TaxID=48073 RepID=UPI001E48ED15|nr:MULTISPECIES: sulfite exporter TauE/SafE family protein [Microbulbifer]UHQ57070.1 sulfite exporter TauE/SafE family protein [Microbulbifer sp. YPW16]